MRSSILSYLLEPKHVLIVVLLVTALSEFFIFKKDSVISTLAKNIKRGDLLSVGITLFIIAVGTYLIDIIGRWAVTRCEDKYLNNIKKDLYELYVNQEYDDNKRIKYNLEDFRRHINGMDFITEAYYSLLPILLHSIVVGFVLMRIGNASYVFLGVLIAIMLNAYYFHSKYNVQRSSKQTSEDQHNEYISTLPGKLDFIKFFGIQRPVTDEINEQIDSLAKDHMAEKTQMGYLEANHNFILTVGLLIILWVMIKNKSSVVDIILVVALYQKINEYLVSMVYDLGNILKSCNNIYSFNSFLSKFDSKSKPKPQHPLKISHGDIRVENLSFSYKDKPIFDNLNLHIRPGEHVAIVGDNGCGKSTLLKLFFRFYKPDGGRILIDNQNIFDCDIQKLRTAIGIIPQDTFVMNKSIYDNVKFVKKTASREEIARAIKLSGLDEVIAGFKNGQDEMVGTNGTQLSGGERQRLAIAKTILLDRPILFIDEGLSAIDPKAAERIWRNLVQFAKNKTLVVITHHLPEYLKVDRIIDLARRRATIHDAMPQFVTK